MAQIQLLRWSRPVGIIQLVLFSGYMALPTNRATGTLTAIPTSTISWNNHAHNQVQTQNQPPAMFLRSYLRNPSDFTTILLIIGGDIIQKALAQLSGSPWGAPVAFSFGWVSYSFSALASVVGDGRLMPAPEFQSLVVNSNSGYVRSNSSWLLTRLLRDLEKDAPNGRGGLCVTVLNAVGRGGVPKRDWVWYIGLFIVPVQFAIALIPWMLYGNWVIFLLVFSGTTLAWSASLLPQWTAEKWCCRKRQASYSITRGNGHRHVFVIENQSSEGLNLEDLAASHIELSPFAERLARGYLAVISILWLVFLICAGSVETDIWYLLAAGFLGMLQNILVAGATRSPWAHGINLQQKEVFDGNKVMKVLQDVEKKYPGVGLSLLKIYFPGELWQEEELFWKARKEELQVQKSDLGNLKKRTTL